MDSGEIETFRHPAAPNLPRESFEGGVDDSPLLSM